MKETIIYIIAAAQCFFAGNYWEDGLKYRHRFKRASHVIITISILFFGFVWFAIFLCLALYEGLSWFHLPFVVKHLVFGFPIKNYSAEGHRRVKMQNRPRPKWWMIRTRIFRACSRWVDKNYPL